MPANATNASANKDDPCPPALDLTKPMQTKGGGVLEIITTTGHMPYPIVGYFHGDLRPRCWTLDGAYSPTTGIHDMDRYELQLLKSDPTRFNLINTPEPKRKGEVWVWIVEDKDGFVTPVAVKNAGIGLAPGSRIITGPLGPYPWTEGEGLGGE